MHQRERLPSPIVEKYKDTICFMVDSNTCQMEIVELRTSWVMPMGYDVECDVKLCRLYILISKGSEHTKV